MHKVFRIAKLNFAFFFIVVHRICQTHLLFLLPNAEGSEALEALCLWTEKSGAPSRGPKNIRAGAGEHFMAARRHPWAMMNLSL